MSMDAFPQPESDASGRLRRRLKRVAMLAVAVPFVLGSMAKCQVAPPRHEDRPVQRQTPLITGVQTHFGSKIEAGGYQPGQTVDAMRKLHAVSVRDALSSPRLSAIPRGQIAARLPTLFAMTHQAGAGAPPLITPSGTLGSIDGGKLPHTPEGVRAYAALVGSGAEAWRGSHALFEVWNEWDKGAARGDHGSTEGYIALIKATAPAIRRAAPDALILAGAAADGDGQLRFEWTKAMIDGGGLAPADAISVHLYDHCSRTRLAHAADEMMGRLDDLHAYAAARAPGKADIYVSEFGWPTNQGQCGVDPEAAAENVAQFLFAASTRPWIRGVWYYELKDSGHDANAFEDNFGLMTFDYHPKPAFCAYSEAAALVRGARTVRTVREGSAMRVDFVDATGPVSVIWLADRGQPMQFKTNATNVRPICGKAGPAAAGWVPLTAKPLFVRGGETIAFRPGSASPGS